MAAAAGASEQQMLPPELQEELEKFRKVQSEVTNLAKSQQQFQAQLSENSMVKEELDLVEDAGSVFKLVGPVLVKQDLDEAKSTVSNRLDFIRRNLEQLEKQISEKQQEEGNLKDRIVDLQQKYASAAQKDQQQASVEDGGEA